MKNKYFILDYYSKKFYGPYTNKKIAEKDLRLIRIISDMFLYNETNVVIGDETSTDLSKFSKGSLDEIKQIISNIEKIINKKE